MVPPLPHIPVEFPGKHEVPAQQPEHESGSHTHEPMSQRWPDPHGGLVPHWQSPAVEQLSALLASHALQASPSIPQLDMVGGE